MNQILTPHPLSPRQLDRLAHRIADDGIAAHEAAVARVVRHVATRGLAPTLTAIVVDRESPPVARERAFARLVSVWLRRDPAALTAA